MEPVNARPYGRRTDAGFTLVEIIVAIVLVGILSTVVVVGVSTIVDSGSAASCTASQDAARTAAVAYLTSNADQPDGFDDLVDAGPLELAEGVEAGASGRMLIGDGWGLRINTRGDAPTFTCTTAEPPPGFVAGPGGHYYQFVPATVSWAQAVELAATHTAGEERGYLATITSQVEHDAMLAMIGDVHSAWLGGTDSAVEGQWVWATGPEAGRQFSNGATPVGGSYVRWAPGEPNNNGNQDCLHLWRPSGHRWDDVQCVYGQTSGYIIEIGG